MNDMESAINVKDKLKKIGCKQCLKLNTAFSAKQLWIASFVAVIIIVAAVLVYRVSVVTASILPTAANTLFAFSLGTPALSPVLPVIALAFSTALFCLRTRYSTIGASMIMIGGISNLLERLAVGYVSDYLSFLGLWSFNLADILISAGAFVIILGLIWKQQR